MNWMNKLKMYQTLNRSGSSTPRLECRLSPRLVIVSTEDDPRSLKLKVSIETTNTAEVKSIKSPVDSDTTGNFIDWEYICSHCLTTCQLSKPVPVFNVDRTPNDASSIIEVVDLILWYQDHSERTLFTSHQHIQAAPDLRTLLAAEEQPWVWLGLWWSQDISLFCEMLFWLLRQTSWET